MPSPLGPLGAINNLLGIGQSPPPPVAAGAAEIARLQSARKADGSPAFSADDIGRYQRETSLTLLHAGFTPQQIEAHWGVQQPNSPQVSAYVANNVRKSGVQESHGATAAFEAGWGTSVAGIAEHMATGQDPNKAFQIKPSAGILNTLAQAAGQTTGDVATDVLGFFGGATAGAAVPGLGETGISEGVGAIAGAAGMGIASQGTREVLLDAYNRGQIHSVGDFLHVVGASAIRALKAGAASAPFGLAGPIGGKLAEAGAGKVASTIGGTAAATALGVSTGAALNGHMPDAGDFVSAAATMLVMHGAIKAGAVVGGVFKPSAATLHVQSNLEEIYRRNGTTPWDAINAAKTDAGLRQEILQQDVNGNSVAPRTHANAPQEPLPLEHKPSKSAPANENIPKDATDKEIEKRLNTPENMAGAKKVWEQAHEQAISSFRQPDDYNSAVVRQKGGTGRKFTMSEDDFKGALSAADEAVQKYWQSKADDIKAEISGRPMKNVTPGHVEPKAAPVVKTFEDLSTALEGSRDDQVSPAGAIGHHQIMLGTARQYGFGEGMSQAELAQWLHVRANNDQVFGKIAADLHARFHGDMNAMLIAYNAGPGRAGQYMTRGPGTELEAIPDPKARGGIRYESVPSNRDESFLPMETQKYLANGRRRSGGASEEAGGGSATVKIAGLKVFPSEENHADYANANDASETEGGAFYVPGEQARLEAIYNSDNVSNRVVGGGGGRGGKGGGGGGEPPDGEEGPGDESFWKKASYGLAEDEIMANIGEPPKPPSLLNPARLMEQYVSELSPARNIDTALVREGGFNRNKDVGQEDMFRQTYASDTRTGAFVRFGVLRVEDNEIKVVPDSASVMKATDQVRAAGGDMRGWTAYMLARRTLDKDKQGIRTGFNLFAAERVATGPDAAKYEQATQTFNKVMDGGLEYGRDSGLFSQAQIDAMMRDNPAYISMRRIMGDNESFGTGKGRGFQSRDPLRQMEGSDRQIVDPIHATIDNLRVVIAMADRNRAIGSIIGQVEAGKLPDLGLEKAGDAQLPAKTDDIFKPYGLDSEDRSQTYQSLLAERSQKGLSPNEFIFYRNGVAERWSAKDPALVTLMKKSVGPGEANIIGKVFDTIARLDRAGVVLDPAFPTRVTLRHQITAFIADPLHPAPFLTWMSGIQNVLTQDGVFQSWLSNGGAGTALTDMDVNWLQRDMEFTFEDQGVFNRMWNRMKHPLEAYQWMSERIDAAARVGYYKQALDSGRSPLKAATMSRKAMLDYAERASLPIVNSIARKVPFLRPKILGIKMFMENAADQPASVAKYGAAGVLGFTVAAVTVPTLALYAANYFADKSLPEEEKYSSIPRWIRDTHYVTPPIAGARVQFPYPFVVGTVFGGLVNRFLDHWVKSDPHAFDHWASGTLSDYDPFEMMPTALKTPVESVANYNFMSGHAIVPSSVEAADGYMQYTNATTEPAKALSRWLGPPGLNLANFSPMQTEHWIDGWTGPVGMGVLHAVNGRMTDYKPPHQMADIPIAGTFFVRNPDMHAQQIEDFYTDLKAMEAAHADWALALKHGDEGEIATAARGPFYGLRVVGKIAAALHIQAAAVSAVNKDTTLRPEEKSQAVDQILNSMIQLSIMGSGVTATLQGKEPSEAFKELDKSGAMATATATQ